MEQVSEDVGCRDGGCGVCHGSRVCGWKSVVRHVEIKDKGKTLKVGDWTLVANGKVYTTTSWTPGKENEKETAVYVKEK